MSLKLDLDGNAPAVASVSLTPAGLIELTKQMKALGVIRFTFAGNEVILLPPEPSYQQDLGPPKDAADELEEDTPKARRARVRRELSGLDAYGAT